MPGPIKLLLIDNYDSFTYNLAHDLKEIPGAHLTVVKNDEITVAEVNSFDKFIISPGPGLPKDNGNIIELIQQFHKDKPILGVCLGLQAIYEAFGGSLYNLPRVHHGVSSEVEVVDEEDIIFQNLPSHFKAGRYHSWVCNRDTQPNELIITAQDDAKVIMACRHRDYPVHGIQFHPESILTPLGKGMLENFVLKT